jgi:hypothetical protein
MFRRRCGAVIDEDYVQEHILTGGNVAPLEAPRRLVNSRPATSLGDVASCSIQDHSSGGAIFGPYGIAYASAKKHRQLVAHVGQLPAAWVEEGVTQN